MIMRGPKQDSSFVSRQITYREVGKALGSFKKDENTSVNAVLEASKKTREAVTYFRKGKKLLKRIGRNKKSSMENTKKFSRSQLKADVKSIAINTVKNTGISTLERMNAPDITDSGMGSITISAKSAIGTKETATSLYRVTKKTRQIYKYMSNNRLHAKPQNGKSRLHEKKLGGPESIKRNASASRSSAIKTGKSKKVKLNKVRRIHSTTSKISFTNRGTAIIKAIATNPSNPLILGVAFIIVVILISISSATGVTVSAPTTILIADEDVVQKYVDKIKELDAAQQVKIENYKNNSKYDDVVIEWMGEIGAVNTNWQELISIIAVEFEQDITFSSEEQNRLFELYNKLNYLTTRTEKYYCSGCYCPGHGTNPVTYCSGCKCNGHLRLYVQVYSLDMEEIIDDIGLEDWEKDWVRTLVTSDWGDLYPGIANISQSELSAEEIAEIMGNSPSSNATREEIQKTALSLVGKVGYFWGGKSSAGWNGQWGRSVLVTASGSSTTGTYQPYGLDCSGFTDWVYKTAGVGDVLSGGGSSYQWSMSYAVAESDLQIGDLVFKSKPGSGTNHVGIYVGEDANGNNLYCHCAYGQGVVVNSYKGLKYFRCPYVNFKK